MSITGRLEQLYAQWDAAMALEMPDYEAIYEEMLPHGVNLLVEPTGPKDTELWWRISKVTFGLTYNYDIESDHVRAQDKLNEAIIYAKRGIALVPTSFEANLAKARAIDRMSFFVCTVPAKIDCLKQLFTALAICTDNHPEKAATEPWIPFLQSNLLSLLFATGEPEVMTFMTENETIKAFLQPELLESQLRRSVELMPDCIEAYLALVTLLTKMGKYEEARAVNIRALVTTKRTTWHKSMQPMLELARDYLMGL